jgi:SAM-dependent methyltransferase
MTDLDITPMLDPSSKNITSNQNSVRLHIGCGDCVIPGFINVDIKKFPHVHHATGADNLHFAADQSVDMIYACHVLEHFGRTVFMDVLREWHRVLKSGGLLRVSVPDFRACAEIYYEKGLEDGLSGLIGLISGGQRDEHDFHQMIFDEPFFNQCVRRTWVYGGTALGLARNRSRRI